MAKAGTAPGTVTDPGADQSRRPGPVRRPRLHPHHPAVGRGRRPGAPGPAAPLLRPKQQLYRDALDLPVDPWEVLTRLLTGTPRDQLPDALARQFVSTWRDPATGARLRALARRTYGDPDATSMARHTLPPR